MTAKPGRNDPCHCIPCPGECCPRWPERGDGAALAAALAECERLRARIHEMSEQWERQVAELTAQRNDEHRKAEDAGSGLAGAVATANRMHRRAQEADHWQTKYARQAAHSKRLDGEINELRRQIASASWPEVKPLRERIATLDADRDAARRERDEARSEAAAWRQG